MSKSILHTAESRGTTNQGWFHSRHTFSFGDYYNPEQMHFGELRVINDNILAPGKGFGMHPHSNMEVVTIPLDGELEYKDDMNNVAVIGKGEIQVMSAGTGVFHSEYNKNKDKLVKFLQIWVYPNKKNVTPRYDQITLDKNERKNKFQQIISPNPDDEGVWIQQDAWFHLGDFDKGITTDYKIKKSGNGVYVFVLKGEATIEDQKLETRDGFGIWDTNQFTITANTEDTEILLMEVPMSL